VASVEDGNGHEIQDAEVEAEGGHECDYGEGAFLDGVAGFAGDADDALQWMCQRSGGGDFLVIRATGTDAYNPYIQTYRDSVPGFGFVVIIRGGVSLGHLVFTQRKPVNMTTSVSLN